MRMNSNNYRIDHPLARVKPVVGWRLDLTRCDYGLVRDTGVMGPWSFAQLAPSRIKRKPRRGEFMEKFGRIAGVLITVLLASVIARADSLELKNGSLINGRFLDGSENEISFQVGSAVQKFNRSDIVSIKFDSDAAVSDTPHGPDRGPLGDSESAEHASRQAQASVTIPAGTRISVRTIDSIDSSKNLVGDRFEASLEEPLIVDGNVVVAKGAEVFGRLAESKASGTFSGRSQLRLELTGIVVNGQTMPLVTGEYELSGKSRGASTAKRTVGGAAIGSLIGALAGGGEGAAIGAGVGAGVGAGSETVTKGDQVKVPSETLIDFTLQQEVSVTTRSN